MDVDPFSQPARAFGPTVRVGRWRECLAKPTGAEGVAGKMRKKASRLPSRHNLTVGLRRGGLQTQCRQQVSVCA